MKELRTSVTVNTLTSQTGQDSQRSDSIGRTVLQTVAQKSVVRQHGGLWSGCQSVSPFRRCRLPGRMVGEGVPWTCGIFTNPLRKLWGSGYTPPLHTPLMASPAVGHWGTCHPSTSNNLILGRPFVKRVHHMLFSLSCLPVLSVTLVYCHYCGQMVGWIKMKLDTATLC